jgi:hypothetical protein
MLRAPLTIRGAVILVVALIALGPALLPDGKTASAQQDNRYFSDTGFRIDNDAIWDYFNKRGKTRTFGMPTSRTFRLLGSPTQFFQRHVLQATSNGVQILNLLDEGLLPYTTMNGSSFPGADSSVTSSAPKPGSPGFDTAIVEYIKANAPDTFDGEPVGFFKTFSDTVGLDDAFPDGNGNPSLLPLLNMEIWGQPTSKPRRDPSNNNFIYLRFQRGIMHYDASCTCTQGLLLADLLKGIITGQNLPDDLAAQATESRLFRQYDWSLHTGPLRGDVLPNTEMGNAFRPSLDTTPAAAAPVAKPAAQQPAASSGTPSSKPSEKPAAPAAKPEGNPKDIVIQLDEAGKQAKKSDDKESSSADQLSYWVRYERPRTYAGYRAGPVTVYSQAIIAKDEETAKGIVRVQAALNEKFPEAKEKIGSRLELNTATSDEDLGDEALGLSACHESECRTGRDDEIYLHHRITFRIKNLVGVVYTWGIDNPEGNTKQNARRLAELMVKRWR